MVDVEGDDVERVYAIQLLCVLQSGRSFVPDFTPAWQLHDVIITPELCRHAPPDGMHHLASKLIIAQSILDVNVG